MPVTQSDSAAGEGEGRHDSQHYRTVNCKRRVKSCIHEKHHGWCSLYLSTGFVGSGQGRKSILSTYISILRLDPGRRVRFLYDLWFPWKRAHIRISLPPAATPYFFCIAGSAWMSCLTKKPTVTELMKVLVLLYATFSCCAWSAEQFKTINPPKIFFSV